MRRVVDAVVVGSGPNGLAAAVTLARAGRSVVVVERNATPGGGARSSSLGMDGYIHDVCSAIHPLAMSSPFFRSLDLARHGLEFVHPEIPIAHPLDDGRGASITRDLDATADALRDDGPMWQRLFGGLTRNHDALVDEVMRPVVHLPRHPLVLARFGIPGLLPVRELARAFHSDDARALLAGVAAHGMQPLSAPGTGAFALILATTAQARGWPLARGGTGEITKALVRELTTLGGRVECGIDVRSWSDLPPSQVVLFDTGPATVARVAAHRLPESWRRRMEKFPRGPGVYKIDYALSEPIPWSADVCRRAGTVHVGGTFEEIARSEAEVGAGRVPDAPYCLVAQQSLFDGSRAPRGKQTAWVYCHVPNGSTVSMQDAIERQLERFAPGFRDIVEARHITTPMDYEAYNPNDRGGDISGGPQDLRHLIFRPSARFDPYSTPNPRIFLCSASTPPGGGVHGMCGSQAAERALRRLDRVVPAAVPR